MPKRNIPYFTVPCHDCGTPVQRKHKSRPGKQARCPECYTVHMKAWQREYGERYRTARAAGYEPTRKLKPLNRSRWLATYAERRLCAIANRARGAQCGAIRAATSGSSASEALPSRAATAGLRSIG